MSSDKKRKKYNILALSVSPEKVEELKIRAAIAGMSLSDFMVQSACEYKPKNTVSGARDITDSILGK